MAVRIEQGRWVVEFQFRGQRVHRRCPPGTNKGEAEALEATLRKAIFANRDLGVEADIPLPGAIAVWLTERVSGSKSEVSRRAHARALVDAVEGKLLRQLPDVADAYRQTAGLAPATINRRLAVLKAVAKFAWRKRWIGENLSARVWLLPEDNQRHEYLQAAQVWEIVAKAPSARGKAWIALAAYTGVRRSELYALSRAKAAGNVIDLGRTKNGEPRLVPVAERVQPYLAALPFTERTIDSLDWEWRQARDAAGYGRFRFHDLRHTTASMLINEGVDLYTVGKILGHKSMQTTKRYAHLHIDQLRAAVGKLR